MTAFPGKEDGVVYSDYYLFNRTLMRARSKEMRQPPPLGRLFPPLDSPHLDIYIIFYVIFYI